MTITSLCTDKTRVNTSRIANGSGKTNVVSKSHRFQQYPGVTFENELAVRESLNTLRGIYISHMDGGLNKRGIIDAADAKANSSRLHMPHLAGETKDAS